MKDYENGEEQSRYIDNNFSEHMACIKVFIFLPKISGYVIYEDNKQRPHFSPRKMNLKKNEYMIYGDNKGHLINNPNK